MRAKITGLAASLMAIFVYWLTLCPTVYVEGSGELIGAAFWLGTPHPTGYPLFCLSSRLVALILPFASPAYEINVASALFAAAACGALALMLQQRGVQSWVALSSALVFAFSRTYWSQAVIAEVYGQALLLVVLVVVQALRTSESKDLRNLLLLSWLMGLGVTVHLMQILVWPGLVAVLVWRWPALLRQPQFLIKGLLAGLVGSSLIAYIPLRNGRGPGFHWDPIGDPMTLWQHLSGALYRGSFFSLPVEGMLLNAERWLRQVGEEFHLLLLPLIFWGIAVAWRRDRSTLVVVGGAVLCNLLAALNYHRDPNGLPVFYLLSLLGLVVFLALGFDDLVRRLKRHGRTGVVLPVCAMVVALMIREHYAESDRSQNRIAEHYGRDILADLPQDAILIAEGDDAAFVLDYLLRVEKIRPDILLYNRVGRGTDLLSREEHWLSQKDQSLLRLEREAELAKGPRPLFYLVPRRAPVRGGVFMPEGLVYHLVIAPEEENPSPGQIEMANALVADYVRDPWVRKIQSNYWFMAGEERSWVGDQEGATAAYERAALIAHDSRTVRFNVGLKLYQHGHLERAMFHASAAADIDPWKPDPFRLMAHIRRKEGRSDEARELLKRAGLLD